METGGEKERVEEGATDGMGRKQEATSLVGKGVILHKDPFFIVCTSKSSLC